MSHNELENYFEDKVTCLAAQVAEYRKVFGFTGDICLNEGVREADQGRYEARIDIAYYAGYYGVDNPYPDKIEESQYWEHGRNNREKLINELV